MVLPVKLLLTFFSLVSVHFVLAAQEQSNSASFWEKDSPSSSTSKDDIYIDDDDSIEGSGAHSEINADLEREYSGSGLGPDDEDSHPRLDSKPALSEIDIDGNQKVTVDETPDNDPDFIETRRKPIDVGQPPHNSEGDRNTISAANPFDKDVLIMNTKNEDRTTTFFGQPGILAAIVGGAVVGLLCAILVVMFIVYRMRKKDEGSYALDEPKRSPGSNSYSKNTSSREFYA